MVLALLWLLAQQALVQHEVRHLAPAERQEEGRPKDAAGLCKLCLALNPLEAAARPQPPQAIRAPGLSFGWSTAAVRSVWLAALPARRSRGPPTVR
jgi:hypothetical protein